MFVLIYNASGNAVHLDKEGHAIFPGSWGCVDEDNLFESVKEAIDGGSLLVVDPASISDEEASQEATIAKQEAMEKNKVAEGSKPATRKSK